MLASCGCDHSHLFRAGRLHLHRVSRSSSRTLQACSVAQRVCFSAFFITLPHTLGHHFMSGKKRSQRCVGDGGCWSGNFNHGIRLGVLHHLTRCFDNGCRHAHQSNRFARERWHEHHFHSVRKIHWGLNDFLTTWTTGTGGSRKSESTGATYSGHEKYYRYSLTRAASQSRNGWGLETSLSSSRSAWSSQCSPWLTALPTCQSRVRSSNGTSNGWKSSHVRTGRYLFNQRNSAYCLQGSHYASPIFTYWLSVQIF